MRWSPEEEIFAAETVNNTGSEQMRLWERNKGGHWFLELRDRQLALAELVHAIREYTGRLRRADVEGSDCAQAVQELNKSSPRLASACHLPVFASL